MSTNCASIVANLFCPLREENTLLKYQAGKKKKMKFWGKCPLCAMHQTVNTINRCIITLLKVHSLLKYFG